MSMHWHIRPSPRSELSGPISVTVLESTAADAELRTAIVTRAFLTLRQNLALMMGRGILSRCARRNESSRVFTLGQSITGSPANKRAARAATTDVVRTWKEFA